MWLAARHRHGFLTGCAHADTWFPNGTVTSPNTAYEGNPNGGTWQPVRHALSPQCRCHVPHSFMHGRSAALGRAAVLLHAKLTRCM